MAHVFLTGERQVGKSSAIREFLASYPRHTAGFLTWFTMENERDKIFYLSDTMRSRTQELARYTDGEMQVHCDVFRDLGVRLIGESYRTPGISVMDELGFMETSVTDFTRAILDRLDCARPVIGVLRKQSSPFLDAVARHPRVTVLEVTLQNRMELLPRIYAAFGDSLKHSF
jgi:nucleoside-triphosphatase